MRSRCPLCRVAMGWLHALARAHLWSGGPLLQRHPQHPPFRTRGGNSSPLLLAPGCFTNRAWFSVILPMLFVSLKTLLKLHNWSCHRFPAGTPVGTGSGNWAYFPRRQKTATTDLKPSFGREVGRTVELCPPPCGSGPWTAPHARSAPVVVC